ncbi:hypothetical protein [Absidia glauca]|uniref:G-patch domain-containing protein n=1 Tax=Absidia glauca TaxID=4829 RepID=A0A168RPX8_ABSGL|nr:hypothetical protein [Absidia glauca]
MTFSDDLDQYLNATRKRIKPDDTSTSNGDVTLPDHERYFYHTEKDIWYDTLTDTYSKYDAKRQYYIPVAFSVTDEAQPDDDEPETDATCRLVVVSSTVLPVGQVILIDANGQTLGRDKHAWDTRTTRLRDMQVSKIHCHLFYDHDRQTFAITDMGSQNGTLLNDERLSSAKQSSRPFDLHHGDTLEVGVTAFQVHLHNHGWPCHQCQTSAVNTTPASAPAALQKTTTTTTTTTTTKPTSRRKLQKQLMKLYVDDDNNNDNDTQPHYIDRAQLRRERVSATEGGSDDVERPAEVIDLHTQVQGKGYTMLQKMGWQSGQGVGPSHNQGIISPLVPIHTPYPRAGVGVHESRKDLRYHKMKQRYELMD